MYFAIRISCLFIWYHLGEELEVGGGGEGGKAWEGVVWEVRGWEWMKSFDMIEQVCQFFCFFFRVL